MQTDAYLKIKHMNSILDRIVQLLNHLGQILSQPEDRVNIENVRLAVSYLSIAYSDLYTLSLSLNGSV
jgi:hypothetical protein